MSSGEVVERASHVVSASAGAAESPVSQPGRWSGDEAPPLLLVDVAWPVTRYTDHLVRWSPSATRSIPIFIAA